MSVVCIKMIRSVKYSSSKLSSDIFKNRTTTHRFLCSASQSASSTANEKEIEIPTPWGHISGVWWGPRDKQPVLALHGWQDNANTWKRLLPLLPPHIPVLAVDFPGHGRSSWYPPGLFYHTADNLTTLRRIIKHFGWSSVSLLGHSMGAIASFVYTSCFPNEVDFLIQLDNIKPITGRRKNPIDHMATTIDKLLKVDERNMAGGEPPSYTYEEMIERLHVGSSKSINKDSCHFLLDRASTRSVSDPDKYYFTRDSRLKNIIHFAPTLDDVKVMASRIVCPHLCIKFEHGPYFERKEDFYTIVELSKNSNKNFDFQMCPGSHHEHLNDPTNVAPLVNSFLEKYYKY